MESSISGIGGGSGSYMLKQMQEQMFKAGDKDNDGSISRGELSQLVSSAKNQDDTGADALYAQLDSDSDGVISRLESDAAIAKASQQMTGKGMRPQGPPPGPPPGQGGGSAAADESEDDVDASTVFDAMDTNKDGKVSLEELTAALEAAKKPSSTDPGTLFKNLGTALQTGNVSDAKVALAALQEDISSRHGGQGDDPFSKDVQRLSSALESGNLEDARDVFDGIQAKLAKRPEHGPPTDRAQGGNENSQDAVAKTLQTMLDALDSSSSAKSGMLTGDTLKSILTTALNSYMQQSGGSYGQSAVNATSSLTATA